MPSTTTNTPAGHLKRGLAELAAEKAIYRILCTYCEAVDTMDLERLGDLFRHGKWAFVDEPGAEPVRRWFGENVLLHDGRPGTSHQLANTLVDVDTDAGTASVRTYVTAYQRVEGMPLQPIFCGRFSCTFVLREGQWWWTTHDIEPDLIGEMRHHRLGITEENLDQLIG